MKVASPDKRCLEIDAPSGRRVNFRTGIADVSPSDAKAIVKNGGFFPSLSGTTNSGIGFRCSTCGFGSFFKTCSRCGGTAVPEGSK